MYKNSAELNILHGATSFNPCFNGSMYKNRMAFLHLVSVFLGFNPCFNGSMYKNTLVDRLDRLASASFNPCFNGSMYKNSRRADWRYHFRVVSILVLMDLCIKTSERDITQRVSPHVSILVLMDLCIKTSINHCFAEFRKWFQSLF